MNDIIASILQWINANPELAGLATFIISAAESVAIIGTIVPGSVMMTAIGALAGAGVMPLWSTIIWAILGAIVGDGISYWIGYHFKDRLHHIWPFKKHPNILARGEYFFHKHGGASVFIGRFVGPVRALVPLVAGMFGMKPLKFIIANVASAIGWAPAYMLPGILLGMASLELPPDVASHALLMIILVILFFILCGWLLKKSFLLISKQINAGLTWIWQSLNRYRYFKPITSILRHHKPSKTYGQLTLAFYFILVSSIFLFISFYIQSHGAENIFINKLFFHLFRSLRTPLGDSLMTAITFFGEWKVLLPVFVALFVWLIYKKRSYTAFHVLALGILSVIAIETLKRTLISERPWGIAHSPAGFSFPSGHATLSVAFYFGLAILLIEECQISYRKVLYLIASALVLIISVSRLYLGMHWFTDVIGGLLLGSMLLMLIVLSYNRSPELKLQAKGILITSLITLLFSYSVVYFKNGALVKLDSALVNWPSHTISLNSWWNHQNNHLPLERINRFGISTQILNLQWLDQLSNIMTVLLQNGWQEPPEQDWINVLHRISDVKSAEHLPLVSPLYLDKNPVLVLIKGFDAKKTLALRLWHSNLIIDKSPLPLWVGTVELIPRTYSWLFKKTRFNNVLINKELIFTKIPSNYDIKTVLVTTKQNGQHQQPILLIKPNHLKNDN